MLPGVGYTELFAITIIAVLLFGKQLPEVARSVGKGYAKFKRSVSDVQKSLDVGELSASDADSSSSSSYEYDDYDEPTAPKFDPPPSD